VPEKIIGELQNYSYFSGSHNPNHKRMFKFQCRGECAQILQSNAGYSAKNLTQKRIKSDACSPAAEI
jgi:hypothetical protein